MNSEWLEFTESQRPTEPGFYVISSRSFITKLSYPHVAQWMVTGDSRFPDHFMHSKYLEITHFKPEKIVMHD